MHYHGTRLIKQSILRAAKEEEDFLIVSEAVLWKVLDAPRECFPELAMLIISMLSLPVYSGDDT